MLGNGATFTLSSGSVGRVISLDPPEETIVDVPDDALDTTDYHEYVPGKVAEPGAVSGVAAFAADALPALGGTPVTGTITYPVAPGDTNPATFAGTGYFSSRKVGELMLDTRILVNFTFRFDGKTGPAYTAGS